MNPATLLITVGLSLLPISELRGAIPFAVASGAPLWLAALVSVAANALVGPLAFVFLETFHKLLYRWAFYAKIFDRLISRAREKVRAPVEKYGYLGILVFVAIPFPFTGAWTGVLGAWVLGMDRKKSMAVVAAGVAIAGAVVSLVVGLGVEALSFFVKTI